MLVPGSAVHQLPSGLDLKIATLTEPLAVVLRAIRRVKNRLTPESKIAIVGAGPIGNLCAQVLCLDGYRVTLFDKNTNRLKLLDNVVDRTSSKIEKLGKFNLIIEATGSADALSLVLKDSPVDGTILLLGFPYASINYNFREALKLFPKIDMTPFIQTVLPLSKFQQAWQLQKSAKHLKILLKP